MFDLRKEAVIDYHSAIARGLHQHEVVNVSGGLDFNYAYPSGKMFIMSDNEQDIMETTIKGIDASGMENEVTFDLQGQTAIMLNDAFVRINSVETDFQNIGHIRLFGESEEVFADIKPSYGRSENGVYTIPMDATGYLSNIDGNTQTEIWTREMDEGFKRLGVFGSHKFLIPIRLSPGMDIQMRVEEGFNFSQIILVQE